MAARHYLDFEKPIAELEAKIEELSLLSESAGSFETEVAGLRKKAEQLRKKTYAELDPWRKTQVARHPQRPHLGDYLAGLFTDFTELHGDRKFSDDQAIIGGLGRFRGQACVVMGHEKGHDTASRLTHNFGMARPEGYRKAVRLMDMAEQFGLPVLTFVDTAGAYPGLGAEDRPFHRAGADAGHAHDRHGHRRRRVGRRHRAGRRQSRSDAGALHLFGDLA